MSDDEFIEAERPAPLLTPSRRRLIADVGACALALILGVWLATLLVSRPVSIGPLTLSTSVSIGFPGASVVEIPPFGEVEANTHRGPLRLHVAVDSVDVAAVEELLTGQEATGLTGLAAPASATVTELIGAQTTSALREFAWLAAFVALVAGGVTAAVLFALRRTRRVVAIGTAACLTFVLASVVLAGATFDPSAFASPHLQGPLAYIPQLQSVFSERVSSIEQLRVEAAKAAENVAAYYADPRSIVAGGGLPDTFRVLHVTDLHLDPVGAEFARALTRSYKASLVIDTGDLSIGGTAEETALLPSLVVTSTPVVFVPGNHDSANIVAALKRFDNYTVATTGTVTVEGLTILPVPDPSSGTTDIEPNADAVEQATSDALARIDALERSGLPAPDIVALHNPSSERTLLDRVRLILSGHTHSPRLYRDAESVRLNSGTTGGMPYDPVVTGRDRLPHSASILYYTPTLPRRLIAVDRVSVGVDGTARLDRNVIDESLLP